MSRVSPVVKRAVLLVLVVPLLLSACTRPVTPSPLARPDPVYAVGYPRDYSMGGPAAFAGRRCAVAGIAAQAVTVKAADGVLGRIALSEPGCQLDPNLATLRLLDAAGRPLPVSPGKGDETNGAAGAYARFPQSEGWVRIGFAWTGSYCGPAAAAVELRVNGAWVRALLDGVQPACVGARTSALVPGVVGRPGEPLSPVPASWRTLHARVIIAARQSGPVIPVSVELTTTGTRPVSLTSPCPSYTGYSQLGDIGSGGFVTQVGAGGLLCDRAYVVEPGVPLRIVLRPYAFPTFSDIPRTRVVSGDPITVVFSMAGLEPATAHAQVR